MATRPVTRDAAPPTEIATAALKVDARPPIRIPPNGVEPAKTVVYTLMTRPRSTSGTFSWMTVLAVAAMPMPPTPAMNIRISAPGNDCVKPRTISATPSIAAPMPMISGVVRPENAIVSAEIIDPSPMAAMRNP
jgi:hypothetical protein